MLSSSPEPAALFRCLRSIRKASIRLLSSVSERPHSACRARCIRWLTRNNILYGQWHTVKWICSIRQQMRLDSWPINGGTWCGKYDRISHYGEHERIWMAISYPFKTQDIFIPKNSSGMSPRSSSASSVSLASSTLVISNRHFSKSVPDFKDLLNIILSACSNRPFE